MDRAEHDRKLAEHFGEGEPVHKSGAGELVYRVHDNGAPAPAPDADGIDYSALDTSPGVEFGDDDVVFFGDPEDSERLVDGVCFAIGEMAKKTLRLGREEREAALAKVSERDPCALKSARFAPYGPGPNAFLLSLAQRAWGARFFPGAKFSDGPPDFELKHAWGFLCCCE